VSSGGGFSRDIYLIRRYGRFERARLRPTTPDKLLARLETLDS
jgi:hypothetical protein